MKVVVIGCTHAGTAAVMGITERYPEAKVTVYEENDNISFLSCGIALYIGGVVKDAQGLFYSSPEALAKRGVTVNMQHSVLSIDMDKKMLRVKNVKTGGVFDDSYDKLVITTGSWPIQPNIEGAGLENVVLCKNYEHAKRIIEKTKTTKKAAIVGAGYIGVELVEAFAEHGIEATIIDQEDRVLAKYLDKEFTDICENSMKKHNITIAMNQRVTRFVGDSEGKVAKVVTTAGEFEADLVVLCVGFFPNTALFGDQLDKLPNGAIKLDEYLRTSREDVFAAGDSCAVFYNPTQTYEYIPLATNAVRMGTLVACNLMEPRVKYLGTQGTSGIKVFESCIGSTGLTETAAKSRGMKVTSSTIREPYRPEFMPTYEEVLLKVVYDTESREILGGQILSTVDLTPAINTLSVCIQKKMTIDELAFVDFFFQPHFNKPWNYLNLVALNAIGAPSSE